MTRHTTVGLVQNLMLFGGLGALIACRSQISPVDVPTEAPARAEATLENGGDDKGQGEDEHEGQDKDRDEGAASHHAWMLPESEIHGLAIHLLEVREGDRGDEGHC